MPSNQRRHLAACDRRALNRTAALPHFGAMLLAGFLLGLCATGASVAQATNADEPLELIVAWLEGRHSNQTQITGMTPDDAISYPADCLLPVLVTTQAVTASIPATCEIIAQRTQTAMTLQTDIRITPSQVRYKEGGVRADGTDVFRVAAAGEYVFDRLSD